MPRSGPRQPVGSEEKPAFAVDGELKGEAPLPRNLVIALKPAFKHAPLPVHQGSAPGNRHEPAQFARDVGRGSRRPRRRVPDSVQAAHVGVYSRHLFAFGFAKPAPVEHPVFETHRKGAVEEEPRLFLDPYSIAFEDAVDGDRVDGGVLSAIWLCPGIRHLCTSPFPNLSHGARIRPFQPRPRLSFQKPLASTPSGGDRVGLSRRRRISPLQTPRIGRPRTRHSSGDVKRLQYSRGTASSLPLAFEIIAETMATTSLGSIPIGTGCPPSPMTHSS